MLILKQIFLEAFFERKQRKIQLIMDVGMLVFFLYFMLIVKAPMLCFWVIAMYVGFSNHNREKEAMPEVGCFVPIAQNELWKYTNIKAYIAAGGLVLMSLAACIYIALYNENYMCNMAFLEYMLYQGISWFLYIQVVMVTSENARWRRIKTDVYLRYQGNMKTNLAFWGYVLLVCIILCWCYISAFSDLEYEAPPSISVLVRLIMIALLALQCVLHRYMKKSIMKDMVYGDYNAKIADEQEVDYES